MYILDTNVVSELRKIPAGKANRNVVAWCGTIASEQMYLSVITILEAEQGVLMIERRDALQGSLLRDWLVNFILPSFEQRILPIDTKVARQCAALHVPDPRPERDAYIVATALVHKMTIVTRNERDFALPGVKVFNPWARA